MKTTEKQGIQGCVAIVLHDETGGVVFERRFENSITDLGRNLVALYFAGEAVPSKDLVIEVGSGLPEGAAADATPDADAQVMANVLDEASATITVSENKAEVSATLDAVGGEAVQALREAGIRIPVGEGTLLYNRVVFPVIHKSANMSMTLTWDVEF